MLKKPVLRHVAPPRAERVEVSNEAIDVWSEHLATVEDDVRYWVVAFLAIDHAATLLGVAGFVDERPGSTGSKWDGGISQCWAARAGVGVSISAEGGVDLRAWHFGKGDGVEAMIAQRWLDSG